MDLDIYADNTVQREVPVYSLSHTHTHQIYAKSIAL